MKKAMWISFDFGMKGDYDGLYKWLDENNAQERGYNLALISQYNFESTRNNIDGNGDSRFKDFVKKDIKKYVRLSKSDRIYMIWRSIESSKIKGAFVIGSSKSAPWKGYSNRNVDEEIDILD